MYNIRYHLITIVAIFIALGLGIFLGGLIVSGSSGMNSSDIIATLKTDFNQLRAENSQLGTDRDNLTTFSSALSDKEVKGKLEGMVVVVLGSNNRPTELARQALEKANATTIPVVIDSTKMQGDWSAPLKEEIAAVKESQGDLSDLQAIAYALAIEWNVRFTEPRLVTDELVKSGALSIPDYVNFKGVHAALNVAMSGDQVDDFAFAISEALNANKIASVGLSVHGGNSTLAAQSWGKKIPASDMLGSPIGNYSIVALLLGADPGFYGQSEQAHGLYPQMPKERFVVPDISSETTTTTN